MERGNIEQESQRGQRANEKERKQKEHEERERMLAEEISAKKLKLNKAGEKVQIFPLPKNFQSMSIPVHKQRSLTT